jgi:L-seryl-tRNA(Ser) seleniumtransferase
MRTYADLGVRPFINAAGTITRLGGSRMPPEVLAAMRAAAGAFVDLEELHARAGQWLAGRIGVPAAFISCGAASGMTLSAAACLTGTDRRAVGRLPETEGQPNEFVISRVDPHTYIHQGIASVGGKLATAGDEHSVTPAQMVAAIGPRTAGVVFFLGQQPREDLTALIEGAKAAGVPVIVDAAAQLPPRANLTELVRMGAELVVFSGGKGLRGPQASGLVLGSEERVAAVRANANPQNAIGRGMKVGKEEIMGLVTAVDLFLSRNETEELAAWERQAAAICAAVADLPDVQASVIAREPPAAPSIVPRAYVRLVEGAPMNEPDLMAELAAGDPPIIPRRTSLGLMFDPMTLEPGEETVIGQRLRALLNKRE